MVPRICLIIGLATLPTSMVLAAPSLWVLLPGDGAVAGWRLVLGAQKKTATVAGLYSIYDGAVPDMLNAGVVGAGQRVYRKESRLLTADIFRFSSAVRAKAYYQKRQTEISKLKSFGQLRGITQAACDAAPSRSAVAYLWCREYYAGLSTNGSSDADREALRVFAARISGKITSGQGSR